MQLLWCVYENYKILSSKVMKSPKALAHTDEIASSGSCEKLIRHCKRKFQDSANLRCKLSNGVTGSVEARVQTPVAFLVKRCLLWKVGEDVWHLFGDVLHRKKWNGDKSFLSQFPFLSSVIILLWKDVLLKTDLSSKRRSVLDFLQNNNFKSPIN